MNERRRSPYRAAGCLIAALFAAISLAGCKPQPPTIPISSPGSSDKVRRGDETVQVDDPIVKVDGRNSTASETATHEAIEDDQARAVLAKAIDFLMRQQGEDGGFKSTTYGPLKQGAAMTSLALYAMSHVPDDMVTPHREGLHRAYMFLRPGLEKRGQIAAPDGTLDYPTYDAALVLVAARRLKLPIPDKDRRTLEQWVVDMQLTEKHGIGPDNLHYGGWDVEAASGASGDQLKGSNIALTALCLEALTGSMHDDASAAVERARSWVLGAQNADGGFVFHPWRPHPGNKAMWEDAEQTQAYSYGTPTCDGLRCLLYSGFKLDEKQVTAAAQWVADHAEVKLVPGFEKKSNEIAAKLKMLDADPDSPTVLDLELQDQALTSWREGLRFYYYYAQSKALPLLSEKEAARRREELKKILVAEQHEDGRFRNEQPRMFEDDPLLATSLAIVALSEALR